MLPALACAVLLVGCGAVPAPGAGASASSASPAVDAVPSPVEVPADGALLRSLGLANGPVDSLSLPRTTVVTSVVDTPTGVSLVISVPTATEVYDYLQRELPGAGFTVTAAAADAQTLTFSGRGWTGSLTGGSRVSGLLLRPS